MALSACVDVGGSHRLSVTNASLVKDNRRRKTGLFFKEITHSALIITLSVECERACIRSH